MFSNAPAAARQKPEAPASDRLPDDSNLASNTGDHHTKAMPRKRKSGTTSVPDLTGMGPRMCAFPDCQAPGDHRAPRSRDVLREYIWLCLDHVREYNASWDYYSGMSEGEIEAHRRSDVTWRRPSWPFGAGGNGRAGAAGYRLHDAFGLFDGDGWPAGDDRQKGGSAHPARKVPENEHQALAVMDLSPPVTGDGIRARYVELVKLLHPDANGGDKHAEERLKLVNQAYTTLKNGDTFQWTAR